MHQEKRLAAFLLALTTVVKLNVGVPEKEKRRANYESRRTLIICFPFFPGEGSFYFLSVKGGSLLRAWEKKKGSKFAHVRADCLWGVLVVFCFIFI